MKPGDAILNQSPHRCRFAAEVQHSTWGRRLGISLVALLITIAPMVQAHGQAGRYMVLYGGIPDNLVDKIARNADLLVLGTIRNHQLDRLKRLNPDIILLKYYHGLSFSRTNPQWAAVDSHEGWFAHDPETGRRLIAGQYGWSLMNIADPGWRRFLANHIASTTDTRFDGVFIDDFWDRYVSKFKAEGTQRSADPAPNLIDNWQRFMIDLLQQLQEVYPNQIVINGAHLAYIEYVDGCMEESFIHAPQKRDDQLPSPAAAARSVLKIARLAKHGKLLLVQSGTLGDSGRNLQSMFRFCHRAYLLVAGKHTYFNFHPSGSYNWRNLHVSDEYRLNLGAPVRPIEMIQTVANANLLDNGNFEDGSSHWSTMAGRPETVKASPGGRSSMKFMSDGITGDKIAGDFIAVRPGTSYRISAWCKAERNTPGSARYKKLGMQGRFFNPEKKRLPGAFDLQFDPGTYAWLPFEAVYTAPDEAAFFQLRIGFIGDGSGLGWVSGVYFGESSARPLVFKRDFEHGSVVVNLGDAPGRIATARGQSAVRLGPREGLIQGSTSAVSNQTAVEMAIVK